MPVQVELRERLYHFLVSPSPKPQHGHFTEYTVEVSYVLANMLFLAGSVCFLREKTMVIGAALFFGGSIIFTVLSGLNVLEQHAYRVHLESDTKLLQDQHRPSERATPERLLENGCYFLSSVAFVFGSLLYIHRFYYKVKDEQIGAWLFVTGSVGYTLASYFNALGMPYMLVAYPHFPFEVRARVCSGDTPAFRESSTRARARHVGYTGGADCVPPRSDGAVLHAARQRLLRDGLILVPASASDQVLRAR